MRICLKAPFDAVNSATRQLRDFQDRGTAWQPSYLGFGIVSSRNSALGTVTVKLSPFGVIKYDLQVMSREWAGGTETAGYGERSMPPEGALVVVAFTDADQNEGIVLGSILMPWSDTTMGRGQKAVGLLATGKENEILVKTPEGHTFTQDRSTKAITFDHSTGAQVKISSTGDVTIKAASGKKVYLGSALGTPGHRACNNFMACLFSGAVHSTQAEVQVPGLPTPP